ncbi:Hsp70 nucleotide exchange factor FES1 [Phlyctema vagabunda]|uniref:Hsp70 nucleotide exchange factor FES1 n=1 Tax=Phlyctema vagabunda TaxID=108571 RepID=A0ABR4PQN2_9HELO
MDPNLSTLLKWSVENSAATAQDPTAPPPTSSLDPALLSQLFGGPSDADLMKASMEAILSTDPEISVEDKLVAFDNFEQLIENLDNANNLEPLALWTPLLQCLSNKEPEIRKMAAWCVGTAVQNNEKSQERLLAMGGIPDLVALLRKEGESVPSKRKACYALSSAVRNYQPGMDELLRALKNEEKVDASDMEAVDGIIGALREEASKEA